jgi:hypothetical protein
VRRGALRAHAARAHYTRALRQSHVPHARARESGAWGCSPTVPFAGDAGAGGAGDSAGGGAAPHAPVTRFGAQSPSSTRLRGRAQCARGPAQDMDARGRAERGGCRSEGKEEEGEGLHSQGWMRACNEQRQPGRKKWRDAKAGGGRELGDVKGSGGRYARASVIRAAGAVRCASGGPSGASKGRGSSCDPPSANCGWGRSSVGQRCRGCEDRRDALRTASKATLLGSRQCAANPSFVGASSE